MEDLSDPNKGLLSVLGWTEEQTSVFLAFIENLSSFKYKIN
jgi:hypothetical protein